MKRRPSRREREQLDMPHEVRMERHAARRRGTLDAHAGVTISDAPYDIDDPLFMVWWDSWSDHVRRRSGVRVEFVRVVGGKRRARHVSLDA